MMPHRRPETKSSPSEPAAATAVTEPEEKKSDEKSYSKNKGDSESESPIVGIRKEDLDEVPEVSSPAPAPIKGGEEDVFTVSHIGRIEIKEKATKSPVEPPPPVEPRRSRSSPRVKMKLESEEVHDDSDQSSAPMDVVDKSPYESEFNAEKGVKIFQEMKELLVENDGDDYRSVSAEATKIFGPTNAWCLVKANSTYCLFG
jgi:hypothetical protein